MDTIAIVGMGNVGADCAYAMMIQGVAPRYVLVDIDEPKRHAHALDLAHGQMFCPPCGIEEGGIDAARGADIVVITAGAKQKPGETRLDLAERNARILRETLPRLIELAPEAVFLIVTNPVDVMTMVAHDIARRLGVPAARVIGSGTVLDSMRLRQLISHRLGVSIHHVHALIIGEHGDSEIALWSSAIVQNVPVMEFRPDGGPPLSREERDEILQNVVNAAYTIIRGKGATSMAIGLATARICTAILRDERAILPVSTWHERLERDGQRIVDAAACYSVPTVVGRAGVLRVVNETPMNEDERRGLARSAGVIRRAYEGLGRGSSG